MHCGVVLQVSVSPLKLSVNELCLYWDVSQLQYTAAVSDGFAACASRPKTPFSLVSIKGHSTAIMTETLTTLL